MRVSAPSARALGAVRHSPVTRPDTIPAWRPDGSSPPLTALPGPAIEPTAVSQVRYPSTDGTEVPMLLVHGEATAIDDRTPTLLPGYGGVNTPETPGVTPFVGTGGEDAVQGAVPGTRGQGEKEGG